MKALGGLIHTCLSREVQYCSPTTWGRITYTQFGTYFHSLTGNKVITQQKSYVMTELFITWMD